MAAISKFLLEQENVHMVSEEKKREKNQNHYPNKLGLPVIVSWHILRKLGS